MFNTGKELLKLCKEKNKRISEIVMEKEMDYNKMTYDELMDKMKLVLDTMLKSAKSGLDKEIISVSKLSGGNAKKLEDYKNKGKTICGDLISSAMAKALSTSEVNASMGKIVAAPTAGASGILPSAIITVKEKFNLTEEDMIRGLFTAGGIGEIIAKNATISGAEGGCQAECGAASAMAAAAVVEMLGEDVETSLNAASFALIHIMGLVCDPVAGLVEFPCAFRNASGVINALISADLAIAGIKSLVPFDEVVEAMYKVGKAMPESLKETALGGVAATPTGEEYKRRVL
ncbi:L-serine ammonia-lyase, iron-sulfur-dependent, subunit alpha [Tepidimicrobium xylanilyticum]|uniref:L-serine ammonia-lyase, iron-sulfur-dependent, subunit alpha n=1 Tax=Tepidimicrobium xylanilyticum TaxID=1123352 RepID=UPI002650728D|nr:L-serine ammonia-lyase, iron-sulfur-dependent, subunit alpha [Tepidimicrobium xylanilyticum]GMG96302.1 L-serine dehydratase, iron-sulfur-dependent subunit alpha [Tepidimicrobium xylanilyticum]